MWVKCVEIFTSLPSDCTKHTVRSFGNMAYFHRSPCQLETIHLRSKITEIDLQIISPVHTWYTAQFSTYKLAPINIILRTILPALDRKDLR